MAKNQRLNPKQVAVLRWVQGGCPDDVYTNDFSHRITAAALHSRGLIEVRKRPWAATITDDGLYYIEHGSYPPAREPIKQPRTVPLPAPAPQPVPVGDVLAVVSDAGGRFRLERPTPIERVSYSRAVEEARESGAVPPGQRLKVSGIKRGPLIIELLDLEEDAEPGAVIPVPSTPDPTQPEVIALKSNRELLLVSDETLLRALALVQAMADECARRGWILSVGDDPSFTITVGEDSYRCVLSEEREKRDAYTEEDLAVRKYDWQRVSPTRMEVYSGRLRLEVGPRYGSRWWADRRRWTLASRLPDVFAAIEGWSAAARSKRDRIAQVHREQVAEWEQAVPRAREAYLRKFNADRARTQIQAWHEARELRDYAEAVRVAAADLERGDREAAVSWSEWLGQEAARFDPLIIGSQLRTSEPERIGPAELDEFMPHRWTVRHPPDPPTYLPS